jgi:hypothetical protein
MIARTIGIVTAASLLCAGSPAAAGPAAPLSLAPAAARAGGGVGDVNELDRRGAGIYIIGAVVLGLIIWGIIELTGDGEHDFPTSP